MMPECGHHWEKLGLIRMPLTYAVGDIHGSLDKLKSLIAACRQHADGRAMTLVFLGDYIDRGPQSAGVVRLMMRLQSELPACVVALMGNHEAMALAVLDGAMPVELLAPQRRGGDAAELRRQAMSPICRARTSTGCARCD